MEFYVWFMGGFQDAGDAEAPESDFMRGFKVAAFEFEADAPGVTPFLLYMEVIALEV